MSELTQITEGMPKGDAGRPPVKIIDVTNRDGVQGAGIHLSAFSRLMLLTMLGRTGVCEAEFGFPCLEHEVPFLRAAAALRQAGALGSMRLSGWCRGTGRDVAAAVAGCPDLDGLNLSVPVSDGLIQAKFRGKERWPDVARRALIAVRTAKDFGVDVVTVNMEDASRTPLHRVEECCSLAREAGADRVRYCDTVGVENPVRLYRRISRLAARESDLPLVIHCHNDGGMAVACSLSAAQAAREQGAEVFVDVTVNGVGERAGNSSLVSFLLALRSACVMGTGREETVPQGPAYSTIVDLYGDMLREAARAARYVAMETGIPLPSREPGIGREVFCHSSGIHVDGMLKDPATYEPFPAPLHEPGSDRAAAGTSFILGPHSGTHAVRHIYTQLGHNLDREEAQLLLPLIQRVVMQVKRTATPDELVFIREQSGIVAELVGYAPRATSVSSGRAPAVAASS